MTMTASAVALISHGLLLFCVVRLGFLCLDYLLCLCGILDSVGILLSVG